jgi:hypothetical protein
MGEMRRAIAREQDERRTQDRFLSTLVIAAAIIAAVRLARDDISTPSPRLLSHMRTSMTEIRNCLPESTRRHYIDQRNIRLESEQAKYTAKVAELRGQVAAMGIIRSGPHEVRIWKCKEEFLNNLAIGYLQDAFDTCRLYDVPLTRARCDCLLKSVEDLLVVQYGHAMKSSAQGGDNITIPLSARQQLAASLSGRRFNIMTQIRVMIERERVEDEKMRAAMTAPKEKPGDTYHFNQSITQHGGVMNASQTGDVRAQQVTINELTNLQSALAETRAAFKGLGDSVDIDESVGYIAGAEKAAKEGNETKVLQLLKQVSEKTWDVGKAVIPQLVLSYLKSHGLMQ